MKDSLLVLQIYRRYLETTGELIEILESHTKKTIENDMSKQLKEKYKEFRNHAQKLIENLNADLHILIRLDEELKNIETLEDEKEG